MSGFWYPPYDESPDSGTFNGSAHSISGETPDKDPAEAVRKVADKITGQTMPRPIQRRIEFI